MIDASRLFFTNTLTGETIDISDADARCVHCGKMISVIAEYIGHDEPQCHGFLHTMKRTRAEPVGYVVDVLKRLS